MRSSIVGILVCVFIMSFVGASYAQSNPCTFYANVPQPTGPNCYFVEFLGYYCPVYSCPAAAAAQEGCPKCQTAGAPISLLTGNTFIEETDVRIPGLSNGLTLTRTWNSKWPS